MKVSVITVSYNAEKTIEATIKSVLSQSYKNIEYVIKDGSSKDSTMKIVNKYKKKMGVVISSPDKGLYDAMNIAVKNCSGEIVCFMNADDVFKDEKVIEDVVKAFEKGVDFVFGDVEFYYPEEKSTVRISRKASVNDLRNGNMPPHQGSFFKRSLLIKTPFDTTYRSAADFDFFCRAMLNGASAKKINRVIAINEIGGISAGKVSYRETEKVVKKHFGSFAYTKLVVKHRVFEAIKVVLAVTRLKKLWRRMNKRINLH